MDILVTGGTGFIGRRLCRALVASGHKVIVFSRRPETVKKLLGEKCQGVSQLTSDQVGESLDGIINLAGEPIADARWSKARKEKLLASRIETTEAVINLIGKLKQKPKVLVSASAVGYYGAQQDNEVTEVTQPAMEFTHSLCLQWEQKAMEAEPLGVRVAIARIGLVVGKGGFLKKMLPSFKLGLGGKLGDGKHWMPWIHIQDLVHIFLHLLESDHCHGPYNAVAPMPVTNQEFTEALGKVLHRPTIFTVPAFVLEKTLGEMARLLLTGQRAVPERLLRQESFRFQFEDLHEALTDVA